MCLLCCAWLDDTRRDCVDGVASVTRLDYGPGVYAAVGGLASQNATHARTHDGFSGFANANAIAARTLHMRVVAESHTHTRTHLLAYYFSGV